MSKPLATTDNDVPAGLAFVCATVQLNVEAAAAPAPVPGSADQPSQGAGESLPKFSMVAYTGDAMRVDGWRNSVVVDLQGLAIPSQRRPIRFGHSMHAGVGHTERIAVENGKLIAEGLVSRDTPAAKEIVVSGKRGFPWQASIGTVVHEVEHVKAGKYVVVNGRRFEGPVYVARKTTLGEISFVDLGADGNTTANIAAATHGSSGTSGGGGGAKEFTIMPDTAATNSNAQDQGTTTLDPTPGTVNASASKGISATIPEADELDQIIARSRAEHERRTRVAEMTAKVVIERPELADDMERMCKQALDAKWDVQRYELEVLRLSRRAPATLIRQRVGSDAQVIEAALCMTGGLEDVEQQYAEPVLQAASQRFRHGLGLGDLLVLFAQANGYHGVGRSNIQELLRFAFAAPGTPGNGVSTLEAAGPSTMSLPGILSNVANKFLRAGFEAVESTWREIAAIRPVRDFKQISSYSLTGGFQYEEVAPGGELKHATVGETSYTNQARTYGRMFSIDRRDIINDDLDALTAVPRRLGRGAALKLNEVFWSTFLNNAAFFALANANYAEGADTAIGIDGLTAAELLFLNQTDPDGHPLGATPVILLVANALLVKASQLMNSTELRDTTANTKTLVSNPHAGKFKVVRSSYLSNAVYTGASAKAWYLLADPNDMPVIEVAFLNGQERPTVESADADFNMLGIQMRGYHDFGVALQEPRGGVKMKGEV